MRRKTTVKFFMFALLLCFVMPLSAQTVSVSTGADLVNRYIWRGLNVNDEVNIQPSLAVEISGLEVGVWGSYALTDRNLPFSQEVDLWLGYTLEMKDGMSIGVSATDYYFPQAGLKIGNFNNWDDPNGPGAHLVEAGVVFTGPESFPIALSANLNIYNDPDNTAYFEIAYPFKISEVELSFFCGATGGSVSNPGYYGSEDFNVINTGISASKSVKISEDYSLPVFSSFVLNPRAEIAYLVFGMSF